MNAEKASNPSDVSKLGVFLVRSEEGKGKNQKVIGPSHCCSGKEKKKKKKSAALTRSKTTFIIHLQHQDCHLTSSQ